MWTRRGAQGAQNFEHQIRSVMLGRAGQQATAGWVRALYGIAFVGGREMDMHVQMTVQVNIILGIPGLAIEHGLLHICNPYCTSMPTCRTLRPAMKVPVPATTGPGYHEPDGCRPTFACYIVHMPYCGIHLDTYLEASAMHDGTAGC